MQLADVGGLDRRVVHAAGALNDDVNLLTGMLLRLREQLRRHERARADIRPTARGTRCQRDHERERRQRQDQPASSAPPPEGVRTSSRSSPHRVRTGTCLCPKPHSNSFCSALSRSRSCHRRKTPSPHAT